MNEKLTDNLKFIVKEYGYGYVALIQAYKAGIEEANRLAQDGIWNKVMGAKKSGYDEGEIMGRVSERKEIGDGGE